MRSVIQPAMISPASAIAPNTQRHPAISMIPWPMLGAIIGTSMNTIPTSDCSRAIRSPSNRSRMIAIGRTESPALARPCRKRIAIKASRLSTSAETSESTT